MPEDPSRDVLWMNEDVWTRKEITTIASFMPSFFKIRAVFRRLRYRLAYCGPVCAQADCSADPQICRLNFDKFWKGAPFKCLSYERIGGLTDITMQGAIAGVEGVCVSCLKAFQCAVEEALDEEKKLVDDRINVSALYLGFWSPHRVFDSAVEHAGFNAGLFNRTGVLCRVDTIRG